MKVILSMNLLVDILSFCVLVLDVCLLLRGGASGLRGLLLVNCDPTGITLPCRVLALTLGTIILFLSIKVIVCIQDGCVSVVKGLFPRLRRKGLKPTLIVNILLFINMSLFGVMTMHHGITSV